MTPAIMMNRARPERLRLEPAILRHRLRPERHHRVRDRSSGSSVLRAAASSLPPSRNAVLVVVPGRHPHVAAERERREDVLGLAAPLAHRAPGRIRSRSAAHTRRRTSPRENARARGRRSRDRRRESAREWLASEELLHVTCRAAASAAEQRFAALAGRSSQLVRARPRSRARCRRIGFVPRERVRHGLLVRRVEHGRRGPAHAPGLDAAAERGKVIVTDTLECQRRERDRIERGTPDWSAPASGGSTRTGRAAPCSAHPSAPGRSRPRTRRTSARCSAGARRRRSGRSGNPKRKCASITSSALFASVALSTVILRPMRHVGWRKRVFSVARSSCSRVQSRNGPPDAVRTTRRTSSRSTSRDALEDGAVLAVDGHDLAASSRARCRERDAAPSRASPCSPARRASRARSAASVASSPAAPTTAFSTMSTSSRVAASHEAFPTLQPRERASVRTSRRTPAERAACSSRSSALVNAVSAATWNRSR